MEVAPRRRGRRGRRAVDVATSYLMHQRDDEGNWGYKRRVYSGRSTTQVLWPVLLSGAWRSGSVDAVVVDAVV